MLAEIIHCAFTYSMNERPLETVTVLYIEMIYTF